MSCEAINSKTRRVFEDFEWLRFKLIATYPNVFVSPLIEKAFFDVNDLPTTLVRLRYLNRFFSVITRKKIFRTSSLVYSFLTLTPEEFDAFKKQHKANVVYKSIEEYPTIKGTIELNLTKESLINAEKIQMFIQPNVYLYEKLNETLELLMNDFTQASIHMKQVSDIFNNLSIASMKTSQGDIKKKAFLMFKDLTTKWAAAYIKQKELFDYQLKESFDYMKREFNQFNDFVTDYNIKLKNFENYEVKLQSRKETLFNSKKYTKWEVASQQGEVVDYQNLDKNKDLALEKMLPKETEISQKNKNYLAYSIQKMVKEYNRLMKYQEERITRIVNGLEKKKPNTSK